MLMNCPPVAVMSEMLALSWLAAFPLNNSRRQQRLQRGLASRLTVAEAQRARAAHTLSGQGLDYSREVKLAGLSNAVPVQN